MEGVPSPAAGMPRSPFRRITGTAVVVVVLVMEVALLAAWANLASTGGDLARAEERLLAFTSLQDGFQEVEFLVATGAGNAAINTELRLLDRELEATTAWREDPATPTQATADVEAIVATHDELVTERERDPDARDRAQELAARGQATARAAVVRSEDVTREQLLADAAAERTAAIVAGAAGVLLVAGAGLVWAVLQRYRRSFDEAWQVAARRQEQLEETNARLTALAETRERFVSVLSHELRTPLAVIGAVGETLTHHGDQLDAATREGILRSLRRQVGRQQRMIDDLLLVARHANADPTPEPTAVDVEDLLSLVRHDEGLEGMIATFEVEPGTVAHADPHHLEQVVHNLVRNAEKYGGSRILVEARTVGTEVAITVSDDGDGVPADLQSTLFEPFTQGTAAKGGVGLGLSITRQLIEANGGSITYRDGEQGGAVFELRLPNAARALA